MRLLLDANVLLDCLVLESNGQPRSGKVASERVIDLCDQGTHQGLVAWHTLPIVSYYHGRQNSHPDTAAMLDGLLQLVEIPTVGHVDAANWRANGVTDFEDALQVASALAGNADLIITRNVNDFSSAALQAMTPDDFLKSYP
jgi:predicted nucleic acid-binding protein